MEKAAGGEGEGVGQVDVTGPGQSGGNWDQPGGLDEEGLEDY